jgi:glycosyltransferase involved in cell wall biosynthesis
LIKVVLAVTNDIVTDNRVHKVANALVQNGYDVTIAGRRLSSSISITQRAYNIYRFKLLFNKSALFYAGYNFRLFLYLLSKKFDIIVANDLDTLPACFLCSKIKRKKLIFDSHELFTEVPELIHRPFVRKVWLRLEKLILPGVNFGYTVSPPIVDYYKEKYNKNFRLVRNVAHYNNNLTFKGFPKEIIIIYQGAINLGRGLELVLSALQYMNNARLWVVGQGDISENLKELATKLCVEDKVIFFGRISLENLAEYTCQAHIGISLEEDMGLNYRYALPNKIFDYIQSRIPVIISDLPVMRSVVEQYKIGLVLQKRKPEILAELIQKLCSDKDFQLQLGQNLEYAANELCWQHEERTLIELYQMAYEHKQPQNT